MDIKSMSALDKKFFAELIDHSLRGLDTFEWVFPGKVYSAEFGAHFVRLWKQRQPSVFFELTYSKECHASCDSQCHCMPRACVKVTFG
jgi:hypothetical protein